MNRLTGIKRPDGEELKYLYDSRGNRIKGSVTTIDPATFIPGDFAYNNWDELEEFTTGENTYNYEYDAEGLRTKKAGPSTTTRYHCDDNGLVIAESNASDQVTAQTIWGYQPLARKVNGSYYYYVYNGHGDVIQVLNESGTAVNSYEYDEWGNTLSCSEQVANPIRYAGEYYDEESGLYYLRARYYDPVLGRFISKDPVEGDVTNPLSLNRYGYCAGNPLIYVDPSGCEYRWIREIAKEVGATVEWDNTSRCAIITYQGKQTVYSIDYIYADIRNDQMYIDDDSFKCAIGAFWDSALEKVVSNNSPAGNLVEAVRGTELFTGKSLSEAERIAKGEKAGDLFGEGAVYMGAGGIKSGKSLRAGLTGKVMQPNVGELKRLPDYKVQELGGEGYTSSIKSKTGKSKGDLYWNPKTGEVYVVNRKTKQISDYVDTIDIN